MVTYLKETELKPCLFSLQINEMNKKITVKLIKYSNLKYGCDDGHVAV